MVMAFSGFRTRTGLRRAPSDRLLEHDARLDQHAAVGDGGRGLRELQVVTLTSWPIDTDASDVLPHSLQAVHLAGRFGW
jgi:hypothetical protein